MENNQSGWSVLAIGKCSTRYIRLLWVLFACKDRGRRIHYRKKVQRLFVAQKGSRSHTPRPVHFPSPAEGQIHFYTKRRQYHRTQTKARDNKLFRRNFKSWGDLKDWVLARFHDVSVETRIYWVPRATAKQNQRTQLRDKTKKAGYASCEIWSKGYGQGFLE